MKKLFSDAQAEDLSGIYSELAMLVGMEAAIKIYDTYRGQQITFPVYLYDKEYLVRKIRQEYNGKNTKQLASRFGYSEKWIRKIINDKGE